MNFIIVFLIMCAHKLPFFSAFTRFELMVITIVGLLYWSLGIARKPGEDGESFVIVRNVIGAILFFVYILK